MFVALGDFCLSPKQKELLAHRATKVTHSERQKSPTNKEPKQPQTEGDFGPQSDKSQRQKSPTHFGPQRDKSHPERQKSLTNKEPKASPKHQTYPVTRNRNQFDKNAIERQKSLTNKEPKKQKEILAHRETKVTHSFWPTERQKSPTAVF